MIKYDLKKIAEIKHKNERLSWERKRKKLNEILKVIEPIEQQILDLIFEKNQHLDELNEIRKQMVLECVHPIDMLVQVEDFVRCKFCNSKMKPFIHDE